MQLWEHDVTAFHEGGPIVLAIQRVCPDVERLTDGGRRQSCEVLISWVHILYLPREKFPHALTCDASTAAQSLTRRASQKFDVRAACGAFITELVENLLRSVQMEARRRM